MNSFPWITVLTLMPIFVAIVLLYLGDRKAKVVQTLALIGSLVPLVFALALWSQFDSGRAGLQFVERHSWIPTLSVEYFVGADGLSLLMLLLTALIVPMAIGASWNISYKPSLYYALILLLEAGLFGTFSAFNFFHWFLFWELSLIPAFFLVRFWGGALRSSAATQFFVYTMVGSIAMLVGFLALALAAGTFDFIRLAELARSGQLQEAIVMEFGGGAPRAETVSWAIFLGILLGFAVKVPLMPFHTWLPATYTEAPSAVTMLLTGLMSKMGVYGVLRILVPIFPEPMRVVLIPLLLLTVATIVLSAWAAFVQRDLKRILAYSSINHLGYCLLGAFAAVKLTGPEALWATEKAAALSGVILQMFNHGLTAAALFCFVAFLERRSGGLRALDDFGGLRRAAPIFCGLMGISLFASLGLPGLNSFVGEFLIFKGTFALSGWAAAISTLGLLMTAVFVLAILQRVFHGPLNQRWASFPDLSWGERFIVIPAVAVMFGIGIYPQPVLGLINMTVLQLVGQLTAIGGT